jgi:hypothetical protein
VLLREKGKRLIVLREESKCSYFTGVPEDGFILILIIGGKDKVYNTRIKFLES